MTTATDLANLDPGACARVFSIRGGFGAARRLDTMGIRPGVSLRKISGQPFGGPVTVEIEGSRIALGCGLARKVLLRPEPAESAP